MHKRSPSHFFPTFLSPEHPDASTLFSHAAVIFNRNKFVDNFSTIPSFPRKSLHCLSVYSLSIKKYLDLSAFFFSFSIHIEVYTYVRTQVCKYYLKWLTLKSWVSGNSKQIMNFDPTNVRWTFQTHELGKVIRTERHFAVDNWIKIQLYMLLPFFLSDLR